MGRDLDGKKIFRKIALERLSSPENLDQVMRVVPPKNLAALICLVVVLAAGLVWAFLGKIAVLAGGEGLLFSDDSGVINTVAALLPISDGSHVQSGMQAHITLDANNGWILTGRVISVSTSEGNSPGLIDNSILESSLSGWQVGSGNFRVVVKLDTGEIKKIEQLISTIETHSLDDLSGWPCQLEITVDQYSPIRLILTELTRGRYAKSSQ